MGFIQPRRNSVGRAHPRQLFIRRRKRLKADVYKRQYLDGETPPKRRIEMVQQFNAGEGQVFLISLKAGGSGLNPVSYTHLF